MDRPGQVAAAMATFTLGCRNGADACAVPEMLARTGDLWVRSLQALLASMDDIHVASAVLSLVALLHSETPAKVTQSVRAPLEKQNLICAKNAFVFMGKKLTVSRATQIVKTMLDQHVLAQEDVSLSCGAAYFAAFLLASKLDAIEPCNDSHLFREVLALYRRVCPHDLPADWWAADGSVISNTSTRLVGVGFLAQHSKSVTERIQTSWWDPILRSAVNIVKVNASAQLCAQDTMSFWPILSSLGIVEAAAKDLSQQKFLLDLGVDEALEYACINDFTFTGRSIANVAAGAMVALVGRNEGGKTLNKDTVDAVLNFLALYFQPDHPAFTRPATTVILPLTTVVTMAISDVNKLLMLQHGALLDTLVECLILDDNNHRKGQRGVDAMQEAATGILLALALFGPGADALRKHSHSVKSLQRLLSAEIGASKAARKNATCTLFQLNEVPRGGLRRTVPVEKKIKTMPDAAKEIVEQIKESQDHVMVSYNWNHQEVILRVVAAVRQRGYVVWIDTEQMQGSTVDTMASAVEGCAVMLIGVSRAYKESSNCRMEAQYGMQKKKDRVPLLLEYRPDLLGPPPFSEQLPMVHGREGYEADGWLGLLLGTSLWYGLFGETLEHAPFERKMDDLVRELGVRGRSKCVAEAVQKMTRSSISS